MVEDKDNAEMLSFELCILLEHNIYLFAVVVVQNSAIKDDLLYIYGSVCLCVWSQMLEHFVSNI